jgi:hypothetical protein
MKHCIHQRASRPTESGYALLLVMFFLALLVISLAAAAPTVLSSIQREREAEMVWRGKQYVRGVRMYYLKMHHFPTALDDLTKPKTGIRFMRQAYKDPMNLTDGSWRLIYVGPNGALIGSLNNRTIGLGGMGTGMPGAPGGMLGGANTGIGGASSTFGSSAFGGSQPGGITQTAPGSVITSGTATTGSATANPSGANGAPGTPDASSGMGQPQPIGGAMDASNTIGGNIIGVGSKINKKSFMVYQKAKNYRQFEFIWDPSQDISVGGASTGIGTPIGNQNTTTPAGSSPFGSPFSSGVNPNQNPNQNQNQTTSPAPSQNPGNPEPPLQAPPNP